MPSGCSCSTHPTPSPPPRPCAPIIARLGSGRPEEDFSPGHHQVPLQPAAQQGQRQARPRLRRLLSPQCATGSLEGFLILMSPRMPTGTVCRACCCWVGTSKAGCAAGHARELWGPTARSACFCSAFCSCPDNLFDGACMQRSVTTFKSYNKSQTAHLTFFPVTS